MTSRKFPQDPIELVIVCFFLLCFLALFFFGARALWKDRHKKWIKRRPSLKEIVDDPATLAEAEASTNAAEGMSVVGNFDTGHSYNEGDMAGMVIMLGEHSIPASYSKTVISSMETYTLYAPIEHVDAARRLIATWRRP